MSARKLNWNRWMQDGDQFLKGATPKGKKSLLGNTIRYNMLSMSLEGYIMAILDYHQNLPENHTYSDLIYGLEGVMPIDESLKERILKYENIQSICSLEKYHRSEPSDAELNDLFGAIQEISKIAHETCLGISK